MRRRIKAEFAETRKLIDDLIGRLEDSTYAAEKKFVEAYWVGYARRSLDRETVEQIKKDLIDNMSAARRRRPGSSNGHTGAGTSKRQPR